jgi:Mce-associated membrane protein
MSEASTSDNERDRADEVQEARMSTGTRPKAAVPVPERRRTVTRRPPRQLDRGAPAEDTGAGKSAGNRASGTGDAHPAGRTARRPRLLVGGLALALAAALTATGITGYRWYAQQSIEDAQQQALAAARQTTVNFVSVSAATVDRDLQRVTAGATGEFKDEFTRGAPQVRAAVVENKVDSRGTVLRTGLVSGDKDSAVALVAVDATVKNVNAPQGRLSHYRIQVDVSKDAKSGRWLVSRLQFVG